MFRACHALVALVALVLVVSCAVNPVRVEPCTEGETLLRLQRSAITQSEELSVHTLSVLKRLDLDVPPAGSRSPVIAALRALGGPTVPAWERAFALSELAYAEGDAVAVGSDQDEARRCYLDAFADALVGLRELDSAVSIFDPRHRILAELHNRALSRWLLLGVEVDGPPATWRSFRGRNGEVPIVIEAGPGLWNATDFDRLIPAQEVRQRGFAVHHRSFGLGAALIGVKDNVEGGRRRDPRYWPLITAAVSAVLRQESADGSLHVFLYDPRRATTFTTRRGLSFPLAADLTAPLAWLIAHSDFHEWDADGFFDPGAWRDFGGMTAGEPYDPGRIPVVLVHGLWSSPLTFAWLANEIRGDPELRARYQLWFYAYPTGTSLVLNAARFRSDLESFCRLVDPEGDDPATSELVVVGHSMGGLLAKSAVKDLGSSLWDATFTRPFEAVSATEPFRATLRSAFFPTPLGRVKRVVFMATPHRGSAVADGIAGSLGAALIDLPDELVERYEAFLAANPGIARDPGRRAGLSTSIQDLSSTSPILAALERAPWLPGVSVHGIIADLAGNGRDDGSDDVVPSPSARTAEAASEIVVRSDHAVTRDPEAWAEVRRILHEHLNARAAAR